MRYYKHVVFDVDGTLLDTRVPVLGALGQTVKELTGRTPTEAELLSTFGIPGEGSLEMMGVPEPFESLKVWNRHIQERFSEIKPFEGMTEAVARLSEVSGVGIMTSKTRLEYDYCFEPFEIRKYFSNIVVADDTVLHKPDPEPMLKFLEITGAKPDEVIYVGDTRYDMLCAHAAGCDFALACWGAVRRDIEAEHYPETPMDLLSIERTRW